MPLSRNIAVALVATVALVAPAAFAEPAATRPASTQPATRPTVDDAAVSEAVDHGVAYLIQHQHENGGWAQGDSSDAMRNQMAHDPSLQADPNVTDTSVAVLALLRAGRGDAPELARGVAWVCEQVETAPADSPRVTTREGTCAQRKLGDLVDTFAAGWMLSEVAPAMSAGPERDRAMAALQVVVDKMQAHQGEDGRWQQQGWATALSQGVATRALNKAAAAGAVVDEDKRQLANAYGGAMVDARSGAVAADAMGAGAGVELYARGSNLQQLADADAYNDSIEEAVRERAEDPATRPADREAAEQQLQGFAATREQLQAARRQNVEKLKDERFVAGFGSNGGEEFLSYLNLGEALAAGDDADAFADFRARIFPGLVEVQEDDGSWSGQHCLTGKTICTAFSVMALCVERDGE